MALSLVVSEIINVEKYRDLEINVRGQAKSLKVVPVAYDFLLTFHCNHEPISCRFRD